MSEYKIIINSFTNPYTSVSNPINFFTYPTGFAVGVTYNGSYTPPSVTGSYNVVLTYTGTENYSVDPITGIYSIVGDISWNSELLAWGRDITVVGNNPYTSTYSESGMLGIQKAVAASGFAISLMTDNSIHSWGADNSYGQKNIPNLNNFIKDISVSDNTTFIIDWSGNLTGCGYLFNTISGSGYAGVIPKLTGISSVCATTQYVVAVPSDPSRHLTGWGARDYFDYTKGWYLTGVKQVCTTDFACVALLYNGQTTGWGLNAFDQLGSQNQLNNNYNVKKIACADYNTILLYNNNTVSGYGYYGDFYTNNLYPFSLPDTGIQGHVLDIAASNSHFVFILDYPTINHCEPIVPVIKPVCKGITVDS
jgi:hypothetical protein